MNNKKIIYFLLATGIALCLLQIWAPSYYFTGDGPCHTENAQVLHDLWTNKNAAFYSRFYDVVYQPNPNWFGTVVMAGLMCVVNGIVAEKLFLTLYVLLFTGGFYLLLRRIGGGLSLWLPVIFLFVFTHALAKGFYNFSFSIAFYYWVVWAWLRFMDRRNLVNALSFFALCGLIFFTHLLSFVFAVFTCGALVVSYTIAVAEKGKRIRFFLTTSILCLLLIAPFAIMMHWFTEKEGGMQIVLQHHFSRIKDLARFRYIVNADHKEEYFGWTAGLTLLGLLCFVLFSAVRRFKVHRYDGLLVSLALVLVVYFFFPEEFLGRLILISLRVQLMIFALVACVVAYRLPDGKVKNISGVLLFTCFIGLTAAHATYIFKASRAVADVVSAGAYIEPGSVVLPLDFSPNGKNEEGKIIADRNWLFCHVSQYLGVQKPLIILDNYEANMGYFPLVWKSEVNPYYHLGKGGSFEGSPPSGDIDQYQSQTGLKINYVLMWCYDSTFLQEHEFSKMYAQINAEFNKVYTSPSGRTILYERK